eukprot:343146-Alexandrium_andersonii.AAC.1
MQTRQCRFLRCWVLPRVIQQTLRLARTLRMPRVGRQQNPNGGSAPAMVEGLRAGPLLVGPSATLRLARQMRMVRNGLALRWFSLREEAKRTMGGNEAGGGGGNAFSLFEPFGLPTA